MAVSWIVNIYTVAGLCFMMAGLAAITDISFRRISNWLCLAMAISCSVFAYQVFGLEGYSSALIHALASLLIGMLLFKFGMVGGGDAKFYSACALAFPLPYALPMLGWTSVSGLLLLVVMLAMKRLGLAGLSSFREQQKFTVPYGVAIAAGFIITMLQIFPIL